MGSDGGFEDEQPRHKVYVDGFWMDRTEVTNVQFAKFVAATVDCACEIGCCPDVEAGPFVFASCAYR